MTQTVKLNITPNGKFPALLAELLRTRGVLRGLLLLGGTQLALFSLSLPNWPCPLRHGLGIACPGCGLTRAVAALFSGEWSKSLQLHAFAPFVAAALGLMLVAAVLPLKANRSLAEVVENIERRTGLTLFLAFAFVTYWLARLLLFPGSLALVLQS